MSKFQGSKRNTRCLWKKLDNGIRLKALIKEMMNVYGFDEIRTPEFETLGICERQRFQ